MEWKDGAVHRVADSLEVVEELALAHAIVVLPKRHAIMAHNGLWDGGDNQVLYALEASDSHHISNLACRAAVVARDEAATCMACKVGQHAGPEAERSRASPLTDR